MNKIKIFSDSTCDLSEKELKEMNIGIIPLSIVFDDKVYKEGVDITPKELFKKVKHLKMLPKTSAPSPQEFIDKFKVYVDDGYTIIFIGISSLMSCTVANARIAADELGTDKVKVMDSLNFCVTLGGLVKKCYDFASSEMSVADVISETLKIRDNYKLFFTVNSLDYLHMGGRCSATSMIFGNTLKIKPVISMSTSGMDVFKKALGKKKAILLMIDQLNKDKDRIRYGEVHIGCTIGSENELHWVKKQITKLTGISKFSEYEIGCVISSHCGEGTVGFGYFVN